MAERPLIRPERPADFAAIAEVVEAAFGSPLEARLVEALRASEYYIAELALVAEQAQAVVGHVMVTFATLVGAAGTHPIHNLSPLAIAPDFQRQGIGDALVREVAARAEALGAPVIVLAGDPAYYGRLGFEPAARYGIDLPLPDWATPASAQLLRLGSHALPAPGRVVYPPAFADADETGP